jgi:protein-tyrosine phosphatase
MNTQTLQIDEVALPNGAILGMSHCPGRRFAAQLPRSLAQDLTTVEAWGASTLLSLVETHEFAPLGVPDFAQAVARTRLTWLHLPITDLRLPSADTLAAWHAQRAALADAFGRREKVLVHCAAGLGRTGMLVARLLVDAGLDPDEAIAQVRRARAGTIQTQAQADFVRQDRLFSLPEA